MARPCGCDGPCLGGRYGAYTVLLHRAQADTDAARRQQAMDYLAVIGPMAGSIGTDGRSELEEHETALLTEMCRVADRLEALALVVDAEGVIEPGTGRAHPALVESRQLGIAFARLSAALRLPAGRRVTIRLVREARGARSARWVSAGCT